MGPEPAPVVTRMVPRPRCNIPGSTCPTAVTPP